MGKLLGLVVLVLGFFSVGLRADDSLQKNCAKFPAPLTGGYCVHQTVGSKNRDVVYYLHGMGGSEQYWSDDYYYTGQIRQYWRQNQLDAPTVISISLSNQPWLLASKNASPYSGLLEVLAGKIIPMLEASIGGVVGKRLVVGESMGGFNTLQLALRTTLFKKAAALCAPVIPLSPFGAADELKAFVEKSAAWKYYANETQVVTKSVETMLQLSHAFFPSPSEWDISDPLRLAKNVVASALPKFYLTAGLYDKYVLFEGNESLANQLTARGASVEWRPQWGGHCVMDIPSLARFLVD